MAAYAIISDIHGNALALRAVLEDIRRRNIGTIINLGDHFFGPLQPSEVGAIVSDSRMHCIRGNTDREILESVDKGFSKPGMDFVRQNLSEGHINWLRTLPETLHIDGIFFACHGTPESDDDYLLEEVTANGVFVYNDEDLIRKTQDITERVILCGHSHVNRVIYCSSGQLILNPGSVGLPAYLGNGAHRFAMESNSPHAKYAVVEQSGTQLKVEQVLCPYDWNEASRIAKMNGNEQWAHFLLHGRMPKDLRQ